MVDVDAKIRDLLYGLGITVRYVGFFHTSYAVHLAIQQPERLLLITKCLYPDVAKHFHTDWRNVERAIRSVAAVAWELCPDKLSYIAKYDLKQRPSNAQFLSILVNHVQSVPEGGASVQRLPDIS